MLRSVWWIKTPLTFKTVRIWEKFYSITEIQSGTSRSETFNYNSGEKINIYQHIEHMSLIIMMLTLSSPESLLVMLMSPTLSEASSVMSVGEEVSAPSRGDIICSQSDH